MLQKTKIACLLCRGLISFRNGDKARFLDHMNNEHDARFDFDVVLVVSLMTEGERKVFVDANRDKLESLSGKGMITKSGHKETKALPKNGAKSLEVEDNRSDWLEDTATVPHPTTELKTLETVVMKPVQVTKELKPDSQAKEVPVVAEPEAPKENPVRREGVLKCKICSKYIKQSQLLEHRQTHAEKENDEEAPKLLTPSNDDKIQTKPSDEMESSNKVSIDISTSTQSDDPITNSRIKKRKGDESDDEGWSPKKGKRKDSSDDEDWDANRVKRRNTKSIVCAVCKKRFSSKLGLTTHERMVHKNKRHSTGIGGPLHEEKKENPPKSVQNQNFKQKEESTRIPRLTRRNHTQSDTTNSLPKAKEDDQKLSDDQKGQIQINPTYQKRNKSYQKEIKTDENQPPTGSPRPSLPPAVHSRTGDVKDLDEKPVEEQNTSISPESGVENRNSSVAASSRRDPRLRTKALSSESKLESNPSINIEEVKARTYLSDRVSISFTPIEIHSTKDAAFNQDENLLVEDYDFGEESPLTIDENVETVTVDVGENMYLELGDISPLLLNTL